MATITVSALKDRLANLLELSKKDADDILWALQEISTDAIKNGDTLKIPGVVKLTCRVQAARNARNPRTGEPVKVPAKVVVKASIENSLKSEAPSLKSKVGKALLADAEEKQAARDKAKRKREREAGKDTSSKKSKSSKIKASSVVKKGKKVKKVKAGSRF